MARRLSTTYHVMELDISGQQLKELINLLNSNNLRTEVKVLDNGDTELTLFDEEVQIPLSFQNFGAHYRVTGSLTVKSFELAQLLQRAIRQFKGNALVHRMYEHYVVEYRYVEGKVAHIYEIKNNQKRFIYKLDTISLTLDKMLASCVVEDQIAWIRLQIDQLLDCRIQANALIRQQIDNELQSLVQELFILEA